MNRKKIVFLFISFIVILCLLLIPGQIVRNASKGTVMELPDGWRMSYNGQQLMDIQPQTLRRIGVSSLKRGDEVVMERMLPSSANYYYPALLVRTRAAAIEVSVNGEVYYSRDLEAVAAGQAVGNGLHFIDLPMSIAGDDLTIRLIASRDFAFLGVEPPVLGDYSDLIEYFIHRNFLQLLVAVFLCVYGIAFLVISLYFVLQTPNLLGQVVSSIICIDVGIWLLCAYDILTLVMGGGHTTTLQNVALYLLIPLTYLYLSSMRKPFRKLIYTAVAVLSSALSVGICFGIVIGVLPQALTWIPVAVLALIASVLMLRIRLSNRPGMKREESEALRISGILVLTLMFWLHTISTAFVEYTGLTRDILTDNLVTFGAVFFVLCQMLNYFVYIAQIFTRKEENETLRKIAFEDALTQLPNKARIEQVFAALDASRKNFCLISMDLNGLKAINDSAGHMWGDHLLMEFAQVLRISFGDVGFLSRVGGDEFIVAIEEATEHELNACITSMIDKLNLLDRREKNINHSVAYGYCFRSECPENTTAAAMKIADERMYAMKGEQKAREGLRERLESNSGSI